MRSGSRWRFGARGPTRVVVVLFWACFLFQITVNAQVKEIRRVLILSDLGVLSSPGFAEIDLPKDSGIPHGTIVKALATGHGERRLTGELL